MQHFYVLCLFIFCVSACKTKDLTYDTTEIRKITFGNGGGFTGEYDTYILLENGQLFNSRSLSANDFTSLPPLDKNIVNQIFKNFYSLKLNKSILNDPGNLTYFLEMKTEESNHKLKWGGQRQKVNKDVKVFYTNLFKLAQRQKEKG